MSFVDQDWMKKKRYKIKHARQSEPVTIVKKPLTSWQSLQDQMVSESLNDHWGMSVQYICMCCLGA